MSEKNKPQRDRRLEICLAQNPEDLNEVFDIRKRVFVDEQKVPFNHERDSIDDRALHVLGRLNGSPIATARVFRDSIDPEKFCIGRLAVLPSARHNGIATALMNYLINLCRQENAALIEIHAQTYVCGFYERLGFVKYGEEFLEENIPHVTMKLTLK